MSCYTERAASVHDASRARVRWERLDRAAGGRGLPAAAAGRADRHVQARAQHIPLHGHARRHGL